jgi:hypothetical protein
VQLFNVIYLHTRRYIYLNDREFGNTDCSYQQLGDLYSLASFFKIDSLMDHAFKSIDCGWDYDCDACLAIYDCFMKIGEEEMAKIYFQVLLANKNEENIETQTPNFLSFQRFQDKCGDIFKQSKDFQNCTSGVNMEDVFKQDYLNIDSELEMFKVLHKFPAEQKDPSLVKMVRFLAMTPEELQECWKIDDNNSPQLLTEKERLSIELSVKEQNDDLLPQGN